MEYQGFRDLKVYNLSYKMAMEIYKITTTFPIGEKYSLVDQIRRSSRSIVANICEAWMKRKYEKTFIAKLYDCYGEAGEAQVWLDMSKDLGYIDEKTYKYLSNHYTEIIKMIWGMIQKPEKFCH